MYKNGIKPIILASICQTAIVHKIVQHGTFLPNFIAIILLKKITVFFIAYTVVLTDVDAASEPYKAQ